MRCLLLLASVALASASLATTTFFTSEADWLGQVTNVNNYGLEGIGGPTDAVSFGEGPAVVGPATFTTNFSTLWWVGKDFGNPATGYFSNTYACFSAQFQATKMMIALDKPVHAFGLVFNNFNGDIHQFTLSNGYGNQQPCDGFGSQNFFGFISDDDISGLESNFLFGVGLNVARFETATPNPVPEPASLVVLVGFGVASARRRARSSR